MNKEMMIERVIDAALEGNEIRLRAYRMGARRYGDIYHTNRSVPMWMTTLLVGDEKIIIVPTKVT